MEFVSSFVVAATRSTDTAAIPASGFDGLPRLSLSFSALIKVAANKPVACHFVIMHVEADFTTFDPAKHLCNCLTFPFLTSAVDL